MHYLPQPSPGDVRMGIVGLAILLAVVCGGAILAVYGLMVILWKGWVL